MRKFWIVGLLGFGLNTQAGNYEGVLSALLANAESVQVTRSSLLSNLRENAPLNIVLAELLSEEDGAIELQTQNRCVAKANSKNILDCSYVIEKKEDFKTLSYALQYFVDISDEPKLIGDTVTLNRLAN